MINDSNHSSHATDGHSPGDQSASVAAIKSTGHRMTPQRARVLDAIASLGGHVAVEEIFHQINLTGPAIDLATVYRTVRLLRSLHLVNEVIQGGIGHYETADPQARHHHMVCEHCGTAIHLPTHYLDELRRQLTRDTGFEPHMEHFTISGLCATCRNDERHSHSGYAHGHAAGHEHGGLSVGEHRRGN
jgi:Fur family ferric uptake transcriptional regulator